MLAAASHKKASKRGESGGVDGGHCRAWRIRGWPVNESGDVLAFRLGSQASQTPRRDGIIIVVVVVPVSSSSNYSCPRLISHLSECAVQIRYRISRVLVERVQMGCVPTEKEGQAHTQSHTPRTFSLLLYLYNNLLPYSIIVIQHCRARLVLLSGRSATVRRII